MKTPLFIVALIGVTAGVMAWAVPPPTPAAQDVAVIQAMIDRAEPGTVVTPPPGRYLGHVEIDTSVTLDGANQVTIDAGGHGSVVTVRGDGAAVMNLHLTGTGENHDTEDAAVQVRGNNILVRDNVIDDALFGIDLQKSNNSVVRRNRITSKQIDLGMRGDSIRLWYSMDNLIEDNVIRDSRDFVLWYSKRNKIRNNTSTRSRYGLHFMFGYDNIIENNKLYANSVGISMMYDEGDVIRHNYIGHSVGAAGTCVSVKEASAIVVTDNEIQYCAQGIALDVSPYQPGAINHFERNHIVFNDIAVSFLNDWHDNEFRDNDFKGNMTDVAVFGGGSAKHNLWDGNSWDTYEGFDRNGDGIGDTPFTLLGYAGQVWMEMPTTRFFKGTPLLEVIDFLDRLAPFSRPEVMLVDNKPRFVSAAVKEDKEEKLP